MCDKFRFASRELAEKVRKRKQRGRSKAADGIYELEPYGNDGHRVYLHESQFIPTDEETPLERGRREQRELKENLVCI